VLALGEGRREGGVRRAFGEGVKWKEGVNDTRKARREENTRLGLKNLHGVTQR